MKKRYTDEQIEFVRSVAPGRYNKEITELFNKKFNLNKTVQQINSLKRDHGIKSGKLPKRVVRENRLFTEEQESFIKENARGLYNSDLAKLINDKFELSITTKQMATWKKNHDIKSGLTGRFEKGHETWNKGKKGLQLGGESGWFKKGRKPYNYRPVGSERICSKDGYILIKVKDDGHYRERWRLKHNVVWEEANGEIPENHAIVFLDGDKENLNLDNLELISRSVLATMNKEDMFFDNKDLTMAAIYLVRLNKEITGYDLHGGNVELFKQKAKKAEAKGIKEETFIARLNRGWSLDDAANKPLNYRFSKEVI